ncbi:M81 family metallopeptidase [Acerihabitans sp. KWT182]|uniref:Microcystinase C n=1 Tax=Acerihabitans sp. KWT182 TaxID=3157919 RepID=A0AAU7QF24_9GAMM
MKWFIAALGTETNTFSPLPTGWQNFDETLYLRQDGSRRSAHYFAQPMRIWREMAENHGDEIAESLTAFAQPGGLTRQRVWERLRDDVLADLRNAGAVDGVLLKLHGAMAADGCDDCEKELVLAVRGIVGPRVILGVELDLHCHLDPLMVAAANLIILYKEYPHTDVNDRAIELFTHCRAAVEGKIKPVMALRDCRMLGVWRTPDAPVRAVVEWMSASERQNKVLSLSFCHGFPWADVPNVGAQALAVTDEDAGLAETLADALAQRILALRDAYQPDLLSIDEVCGLLPGLDGVSVVADIADNPGGGAAGDATFLLQGMLRAKPAKVLFGNLWDPVAVRICQEAGEGALLPLRIGGKVGPQSGSPVDLNVRVLRIVENAVVTFGAGRQPMGDAVLLDADGLHIVINTVRTQTFHPDAYTQFGIRLGDYRVVVVKSAQHFHAGFAPVADRVLYVSAPGTVSPDFQHIPLPKAGRPLWPQAADPFTQDSAR